MTESDETQHLRLAAEVAGVEVARTVLPESRNIIGELRLHYLDWGTRGKTPIVFLHGGGLTAHTWDLVCLALRNDYHCLALDLRGHGDSEWSPVCDYDLDAHLRDVRAFIEQLGLTRFVLAGQSLGGITATRYAIRYPDDLVALVVVDVGPHVKRNAGIDRIVSFALGPNEFTSIDEAVEAAVAFNPRRDPRLLRQSLRHSLRALPDGGFTWKRDRRHLSRTKYDELIGQVRAVEPEIGSIRCPVLIVRGSDSQAFTAEEAEAFARGVPDGRVAVVSGSGHNVQGDNPRGLVGVLRTFLEPR